MSSEAAPPARRGLLFVVSAPSGTGKTTVVERLVHVLPDLALSRSYTSRAARPGETDGVDYNFVSRARFEEMVAADAFLEWADVFGNFYGTCATDAERDLSQGRDLVLVIDVQGARQVRQRCRDTVGVFVMPPSFAVLEQRLRGRSKDTEEAMQRRLADGAGRGRRLHRVRLRHRQRRARGLRRSVAFNRHRRADAAALGARRSRADRQHVSRGFLNNARER